MPRCGCYVSRFREDRDAKDADELKERLSLSGITEAVFHTIRADSTKYTADNDHITVDTGTA